MSKEVLLVTGAGQISMAIARRIGYGKKIILGDKNLSNAKTIAETMNNAGFDAVPFEMDLSSRESIRAMIAEGQKYSFLSLMHTPDQHTQNRGNSVIATPYTTIRQNRRVNPRFDTIPSCRIHGKRFEIRLFAASGEQERRAADWSPSPAD